ncbi:AAA-domain-containing protein, partial [Exidia glandulosa HHB12029]
VVRQAATLSFRVPDTRVNGYAKQRHRDLKYKVLACEPVMQGVVRIGVTRFFVARAPEGIDERPDLNGDSSLLDGDDSALPSPVSDASDAFEIDEHFLASSLVSPLIRRPPYTYAASSSGESTDLSSEDENGQPKHQNLAAATVETLVPRSAPETGNDDEEERILYVSPLVLGRVGVFSGDWAIVGRERSTDFRLVRLLTRSNYDRISSQQQALHASPVLAANIQPDLPPLTSSSDSRVTLRASPFGSHTPPIPTARAVTIARVASPASTDRTLQPLFLRALRSFFAGRKRLVKKGDLVAVKIDRTHASLINPDGEDDGEVEDILSTVYDSRSDNATDVVWFKITNLEYDVLDLPDDAASGSDSYVAATMGELGVWVDTDVTKMMQSGLEHSRVPDVQLDGDRWLSIGLSRAPLQDNANGIKLTGILSACLRPVAWEYQLHVSVLLKGARGVGKSTCAAGVARSLGLHLYEVNCYDLLGESEAATEGTLRARFERAAECAPCVLLLRHLEALARNSQVLETGRDPLVVAALRSCIDDLRAAWRTSEFPVFVLGTTSDADKLPPSLLGCFKHEIVFQAPAEADRLAILQGLLAGRSVAPEVDIPSLATQTAALVAGDLVDLVSRAELAAVSRALKDSCDVLHAGIALTSDDFDRALGKARAAYSESIGAPRIPNVTWDDVGGLADVKSDILDTIQLPLEHPELFAEGLKKRSGILLYGPPGTGKTLLAKAVATSCSLNFFSVKGPELLNMYIGESEANVRRVFQRARDARPCVIFFDELDSVAPKRGIQGDSGGVMDRIVSQLLAELDGIAEGDGVGDVFVIGATNRPDLLDPALLRPGRFDRMLYLGISDTHNAQLRILQALTRKFKLHPDLDLGDIAERCPFNYTGADFYALCSDAMLKAMSRKAQEVDAKIGSSWSAINESPTGNHPHPMTPQYYLAELATPDEISVLVGKEDFEDALRELTPSVSQSELEHYATVQARFANETIGSKKKGKGRA